MLSRYRLGDFLSRAGMRDVLALPLGGYFIPSGYARCSRVTAWALFYPERVCETFLHYHLGVILSRAGMQDVLALPLGRYFIPSGCVRCSHVTAWPLFYPERVCETCSRYRLGDFLSRAGMRDVLALPLGRYFIPSGYARRACITAWAIFYPERVCEMLSRYRLAVILSRAGMRDALALPLGRFFIPSGYARRARVTAWALFYPERVCETFLHYHLGVILSRAGMQDVLALPLGRYFIPSGCVRCSHVTAWAIFYPERVCETCSRYRLGDFLSRAGMRDVLALPLGRYFIPSGYARRSNCNFCLHHSPLPAQMQGTHWNNSHERANLSPVLRGLPSSQINTAHKKRTGKRDAALLNEFIGNFFSSSWSVDKISGCL